MLTRRDFSASLLAAVQDLPDIRTVAADLTTPDMVDAPPAPGRRVRQTLAAYSKTEIHHALHLPEDWKPGGKYPLIVEYAGNGNFSNNYGDVSTGLVEGSNLGYGMSGGRRFIWLCLPYVNTRERKNEIIWWGDPAATAAYCREAVAHVCGEYGADPESVILAGFSRGSIACNFIGLRDDKIARLWRAFVPYSHYDGVLEWEYSGSDRRSALHRLRRLKSRPQFICHERSVEDTRRYLAGTGVHAPFTFQALGFRNHNDAWVLRDVPERRLLRQWLSEVT